MTSRLACTGASAFKSIATCRCARRSSFNRKRGAGCSRLPNSASCWTASTPSCSPQSRTRDGPSVSRARNTSGCSHRSIMAFSSWRLVLAGLSRPSSRPLQALHDRAAHHPVLVALAEEAQLLRELGDALAIARLGERIGEIGAPIAALRAVGVEDALQMHRDVAKWI